MPADHAPPPDDAPRHPAADAAPAPAPKAVLVPRVARAGRYHRAHVANARLEARGDTLVVTDGRGRHHTFALDGSPEAPAAVGVVLADVGVRGGDPHQLVVADGRDRVLVVDGQAGLWREEDIDMFAHDAGLRVLPCRSGVVRPDPGRRPVAVQPTPWLAVALGLAFLPAGAVLALAGVTPWLAIVALAALVAAMFAAAWWGRVALEPGTGPAGQVTR